MNRQLMPYGPERASIVVGSFWMVGITLLLFFLPAINGLIGGLIGGYRVGSPGRALSAAILPAVVVALGLWGLMAMFQVPLLGLLAGATVGAVVALSELSLFVGALIGGLIGRRRAAAVLV